jgi:hypothetical protein
METLGKVMATRAEIAAWAKDTQRRVAAGKIDLRDWGVLMNNCWDQDFPASVLEVLAAAAEPRPEPNDDAAFRAGRELLIAGGEKAIDMIASGNFYEDYDASTEALGDLRSLLDAVKDTLLK